MNVSKRTTTVIIPSYTDAGQKREEDLRIPGAKVSGLLQVSSGHSGAWHKMNILLWVKTHFLQKWH